MYTLLENKFVMFSDNLMKYLTHINDMVALEIVPRSMNSYSSRCTQTFNYWDAKDIFFILSKELKMSSFKSSENIQKKEGGPDRSDWSFFSLIELY